MDLQSMKPWEQAESTPQKEKYKGNTNTNINIHAILSWKIFPHFEIV
jgi:hypothetical protein